MKPFELKPIGVIHSPFREAAGTPIQPALAKGAEGSVEIFPQYAEELKTSTDSSGYGWFTGSTGPGRQS